MLDKLQTIIRDKQYRDNFRKVILSHIGDEEVFAFHPQIEEYLISSHGRVKSLKTHKILKSFPNQQGYQMINLIISGKRRCCMVHRIVLETFMSYLGLNNYFYETNHIDGNKINNNITNLNWLTRKENLDHMRDNRLFKVFKGAKNGNSKLSFSDVNDIIELHKLGFSVKSIADSYNMNRTWIGQIINKKKRIDC